MKRLTARFNWEAELGIYGHAWITNVDFGAPAGIYLRFYFRFVHRIASFPLIFGFTSSKTQACRAYLRTGPIVPHNRTDMCVIL